MLIIGLIVGILLGIFITSIVSCGTIADKRTKNIFYNDLREKYLSLCKSYSDIIMENKGLRLANEQLYDEGFKDGRSEKNGI